jgi:hypothetical protein
MKITREVITDLLPIYQSGEASQDTRNLVEAFLKEDPEFARIANAEQTSLLTENQPNLSKENEMKTLEKTKKLLKQRSFYMAFAILFTLSIFSFNFDSQGAHWTWAETPMIAFVFFIVGIFFWVKYSQTKGKLNGSAL